MALVFVSYRRIDSAAVAGRIYDRLIRAFGRKRVFMDVEGSIPQGADFPTEIKRALTAASALLVVIGRQWITCTDEAGKPRISNEDDWVANEIAVALDRNILVLPVLVDGAHMPSARLLPRRIAALGDKQACEIHVSSWDDDVRRIVARLRPVVRPWARRGAIALTGITILSVGVLANRAYLPLNHGGGATQPPPVSQPSPPASPPTARPESSSASLLGGQAVTPAELTAELRGGSDQFVQLALLTNGRLASASGRERFPSEVKIWNLATLIEESTITNATAPIAALPDNKILASRGGGVVVWGPFSAPEEKFLDKVEGSWGYLDDLAVGHGKVIGCSLDGGIAVWSLATGKLERRIQERLVVKLLLRRDGRLVTGRTNGLIEIWNVSSGEPPVLVREGTSSNDWITALVELHDGRLAYTTADGTAVNIWSHISNKKESVAFTPGTRASGSETTLATTPGTGPYGLAVLADGQLAILEKGGGKNRVAIWNRDASRRNGLFEFDAKRTGQLSFGANLVPLQDGRFATGGYGRVQIWRLPRAAGS